jgi:hypothetical protein
MLDIEKLSKEFAFLRDKIKEISVHAISHEITEATFKLGCLHSICHNHAVWIGALVPPKFEPLPETPKNEPSV